MNREPLRWVTPDWNLPSVRVISTLRCGGVSDAAYASLNLATHVGDRGESVTENRRLLRKAARLPREPFWLEQVHGARVVLHDDSTARPKADASVAFSAGQVCAVLTADCLPVVFTDRTGSRIAVAHAGWRGLLAGVLTATVRALRSDPANLLAWLARPFPAMRSRWAAKCATRSCCAMTTFRRHSWPMRAAATRPIFAPLPESNSAPWV